MAEVSSLAGFAAKDAKAIRISPVSAAALPALLASIGAEAQRWADSTGFKAEPGSFALLPDGKGGIARVLVGIPKDANLWALAALPAALPEGIYDFESSDRPKVERLARAVSLARDLINTPAGDMGPEELQRAVEQVARDHNAGCRTIIGDELLAENYPTIHAVGRASPRAPRLIDMVWGDPKAPKLTLIGKGVCFDSGGLDIKTASGMRLMKKDMGGAATLLGLAAAIMAAGLNVRLRLLIPAVENSIAGNALRPMDIIRTRQGLTVEVGDTDAEGRLILCDALAEAATEKPARESRAPSAAAVSDSPTTTRTDDRYRHVDRRGAGGAGARSAGAFRQ